MRRRRQADADRRDRLLARAREILNRAKLAENRAKWDNGNVAYVMHPETARFLLEHRPELFKHRPDDWRARFRLDDVAVYFSEELAVDDINLAVGWWPIVPGAVWGDNPDLFDEDGFRA